MIDYYNESVATLLGALSNPVRLTILEFLYENKFGTLTLVRDFLAERRKSGKKSSPSVAMFHIKKLMNAGLVRGSEYDSRIYVITEFGKNALNAIHGIIKGGRPGVSWERSL